MAPFRLVRSLDDLTKALAELGTPSILKTAGFGYDGKGQVRIKAPEEAAAAWASLKTDEAVLEGFIDFERELSIIAARTEDGQFTHYGLVENRHKNHILDLTIAHAPHSAALLKEGYTEVQKVREMQRKEYDAATDAQRAVEQAKNKTSQATQHHEDAKAWEAIAEAIHEAVVMPPREVRRRMARLRERVEDQDVYKWAGSIMKKLARL